MMKVRTMMAGVVLAGIALTGCGGAAGAGSEGAAAKLPVGTTTTAPEVRLALDSSVVDGDVQVTASENACARTATTAEEVLACLGKGSLLLHERAYLEDEVGATDAQVACVIDALGSKPVAEIRSLSSSGIGQAVYVPCGLPD